MHWLIFFIAQIFIGYFNVTTDMPTIAYIVFQATLLVGVFIANIQYQFKVEREEKQIKLLKKIAGE